jgi:hypothetical protein
MKRALLASLLAGAFALAAIPAHADRDAVQFGSDINVSADNPVHDAVCFFCSVRADGKVNGDIVVFFGSIRLAGEAHHDVVNFFGNITAADNSSIGGDMVSIFGGVRLGENVTVGKDLVAMFGTLHAPASARVGGDRVIQPGLVLTLPPLVLLLVIFLIIHEYRAYRRRQLLLNYPFPPHP